MTKKRRLEIERLADFKLADLIRQHNATLACGMGSAGRRMLEEEIAVARDLLIEREKLLERVDARRVTQERLRDGVERLERIEQVAKRLRTAEERGRAHVAKLGGPRASEFDVDVYLAAFLTETVKTAADEIQEALAGIHGDAREAAASGRKGRRK
jgi:hypothetical protein